MTNEELKKKIADIVLGVEWTGCLGNTYHISGGMSVANAIADALIEAGLNFGKVVSHTATFDIMQLDRINYLERQVAEEEHRAARAERALDKAVKLFYEYRIEFDVLSCSSCWIAEEAFKKCEAQGLYKDCLQQWKEEILIQAEKELTEEGKEC